MRAIRRFLAFVLIASAFLAAATGLAIYVGATRWRSQLTAEVLIEPGMSMRAIAARLAREGVIGTPRLFEVVGRARGVDRRLKAGTYEFPAGVRMPEVMGMLARGEVKQYAFTVIEGWTIADIARALERQPFLVDDDMPARFAAAAREPGKAAALGFEGAPTLEGYLFPDTYLVAKPLGEAALIKVMTDRFAEVWKDLSAEGSPREGMGMRDVVTLASIVEKETGDPSERPLIASVFFNRLGRGMPLQSDPTIIYGLVDFDGNIRKQDISNPHRYNTYLHPGLPPGPICSPGKASLAAVLNPSPSDYLYFVSKKDGTHEFSATLSEHSSAVRRYQLNGGRMAGER
ncbi:MAG: endolytic transglycosylase MltG [Proteobacteria bacterium]|nr:endolytic transglycosylase MltG [Pseudomonadota bacterium]